MNFASTPFTRTDLPQLNAFISANAVARAPVPIYLMTSDVAWRLPGAGAKENLRLWRDDDGLAGFVWFEPTTGMEFDLRHDLDYDDVIASDMLAWAEARQPAAQPTQPMGFFVTSTGMGDGANLGGLAGADKHCQTLAAAADHGAGFEQ